MLLLLYLQNLLDLLLAITAAQAGKISNFESNWQ